MPDLFTIAASLVGGFGLGWLWGTTRVNAKLAVVRAQAVEAFCEQLDLLKPACTGSRAALQLVETLSTAVNKGTVNQEALRREIAQAVDAEHAAIRDPWVHSTAMALLQVTRAAACLKVVDCAVPRERLLVQDAQVALEGAQAALLPRPAPTVS